MPSTCDSPKFFTIIIPTFNRPALLGRAIESILRQNFHAYELVVVDDCSIADYTEVLSKYGNVIARYIRSPVRKGVSHSRNLAMKGARGSWILFLDDDDELNVGALQSISDYIKGVSNVESSFFWTSVCVLSYDNANSITSRKIIDYSLDEYGKTNKVKASTIGCSYGLVVNRNVVRKNLRFDEALEQAEDTDFVIQLMSNGYAPTPVNIVGIIKHNHSGSRLSGTFNIYSRNRVYEKIYEKHKFFLSHNRDVQSSMLHWSSTVHYWAGDLKSGDIHCLHYVTATLKNLFRLKKLSELLRYRNSCKKSHLSLALD